MMSDPNWIEIKASDSKDYYIRASWEARAETPDRLALRFLRMIDSLREIDPAVFGLWTCGARRPRKFELDRDRYSEEIAAGVMRDDWGKPTPIYGYWFGARTRDTPDDRTFGVRCHAGGTVKESFPNAVTFETSSSANLEPDPAVVSHRIFRAAMLAIVDAWEPACGGAYSRKLIQLNDSASHFPAAWIQYLCPRLAKKVTSPSTVLAEHLPNGGLLMTATMETFDVHTPAHLAAAQDMAAAMAPLDALPWPSGK